MSARERASDRGGVGATKEGVYLDREAVRIGHALAVTCLAEHDLMTYLTVSQVIRGGGEMRWRGGEVASKVARWRDGQRGLP